jgi:hypothetical protein
MTQNVELTAYFERARGSRDGLPAEGYVAGFRGLNGSPIGAEVVLPAEVVEQAVLVGSGLTISLAPDGRLFLDGDGLADEALAEWVGGGRPETLESLVAACLDPELLAGEYDAIGDLTALRGQFSRALALIDGTLERLKQR